MDPTIIARIAHEADRTLAAVNGDMTVPGWPRLQAWERSSLVAGVKLAIATPGASAEILHAAWRHDKIEAGWTLGPRLDVASKTDPLLQAWSLLTPLQRRREAMCLALIRSLSPEI